MWFSAEMKEEWKNTQNIWEKTEEIEKKKKRVEASAATLGNLYNARLFEVHPKPNRHDIVTVKSTVLYVHTNPWLFALFMQLDTYM